MRRTENVYKELKSKIEGLVEFMVSNGLNSADINLEMNEEFTLCNVKYSSEDEVKDEFLYLFKDSETLSENYLNKLTIEERNSSISNLSNENSLENTLSINEDNINDESKAFKKETQSKSETETELATINNESEKDCNLTEPKQEIQNNEEQNEEQKEQKEVVDEEIQEKNNESSKSPINFKDEFIFQKEMILSILKEYNLIS